MIGSEIEEVLKDFWKTEKEAKEIRRRMADWDFIKRQSPRVRAALEYYVETGDIRRASRIAGMNLSKFRKVLREAHIPVVV